MNARVWFPLLAAALFFCLYYNGAWHLSQFTFNDVDRIYHADTGDFVAFYREGYAEGFMHRDPFTTSRHLAFRPVATLLITAVHGVLFFVERDTAMVIVMSLMGALNIVLAFFALYRFRDDFLSAALFTLAYGFAFSNVVFFSIPETYVYSNAVILTYWLLYIRFQDRLTPGRVMILSALVGAGALFNPPLLSLVLGTVYLCYRRLGTVATLRWCGAGLALTGVLFLVPYSGAVQATWKDPVTIDEVWRAVEHLSGWENLFWGVGVRSVLFNFFIFSIITPKYFLADTLPSAAFLKFFTSWRIIFAWAYLAALGVVSYHFIRRGRHEIMLPLVAWLVVMATFYIYFNPLQAILFSSQMVFPLILLFYNSFHEIEFRHKYAAVGVFVVLMALNNSLAVFRT